MSTTVLISLIGLLSVLSTVYMGIDLWRKRISSSSTDVVSSAVELLKPYKTEVTELRHELSAANSTIRVVRDKLSVADIRAEQLNEKLASCHTEMEYLRMQMRLMSKQVKEDGAS